MDNGNGMLHGISLGTIAVSRGHSSDDDIWMGFCRRNQCDGSILRMSVNLSMLELDWYVKGTSIRDVRSTEQAKSDDVILLFGHRRLKETRVDAMEDPEDHGGVGPD